MPADPCMPPIIIGFMPIIIGFIGIGIIIGIGMWPPIGIGGCIGI